MRRDYRTSARAHILKEAIDQYRSTQEKIASDHPGLLCDIRTKLAACGTSEVQTALVNPAKNLDTIIKFTELETGSALFQSKLKQLLQSHHLKIF